MRITGRVQWFNDTKGYGLIHSDRGEDVLVRSAAIQGEGFGSLEQGQTVEFEIARGGPNGPEAEKVVAVGGGLTIE